MTEDRPLLNKVTYEFLQDTNTNGTTGKSNEDELITITYESVCGPLDEEPGFYVIRTSGWSIDKPSELLNLFSQIINIKHG